MDSSKIIGSIEGPPQSLIREFHESKLLTISPGRAFDDLGLAIIYACKDADGQVFNFGTYGNGSQGARSYDVWNFWGGAGAHRYVGRGQAANIFCAGNELLPNGDVLVASGDTRNPVNAGIKDTFVLGTDKNIYRNYFAWLCR